MEFFCIKAMTYLQGMLNELARCYDIINNGILFFKEEKGYEDSKCVIE